jgi:chromate transporter
MFIRGWSDDLSDSYGRIGESRLPSRVGADAPQTSLLTVGREWGRIGCVGFGGPPAHIRLLRELCVERRGWIDELEFEDAIAACNLLPGPASTQLAIFCGWRVRGRFGALVGGAAFILPGLAIILLLAALFLADAPPRWVLGAAAGTGAAVAAIAGQAGVSLMGSSWRRRSHPARWIGYLLIGAVAAALFGPYVVLALLGCGLVELIVRSAARGKAAPGFRGSVPFAMSLTPTSGGLWSVSWVALKVGLLSYGGGFVIIPLMQTDAVDNYHWMSGGQFLNAVALGQITPGPVVHTVAVIGYAAAGLGGALLATVIAFLPSFLFVLLGARHFDTVRGSFVAASFFAGAGPAAIGAILGSTVPLVRALTLDWQYAVLSGAVVLALTFRRSPLPTLLGGGVVGVLIGLLGGPLGSAR